MSLAMIEIARDALRSLASVPDLLTRTSAWRPLLSGTDTEVSTKLTSGRKLRLHGHSISCATFVPDTVRATTHREENEAQEKTAYRVCTHRWATSGW